MEIFAKEGASVLIAARRVDDIARAAVFLASDESTFINGHNLVVDGGLTGGRLWSVQQEGLNAMRQALSDASKS